MKRLLTVSPIAFAVWWLPCSATDDTSHPYAYYVLPDGVLQSDFIPPTQGTGNDAGTPQWFVFRLESRRSYVFEVGPAVRYDACRRALDDEYVQQLRRVA